MERGQRPAQHRGRSTYRSPQNVSVNWSFRLQAAQMPWKWKYEASQPACLPSSAQGISPHKHCYVCLSHGVTGTASAPSPIFPPTVIWGTEQKLPIDWVSSWVAGNITSTYIFRFFLLAFTFLEINLFLCHKSSRFCAFKNMLGNIILTSKRFFLFSLCSFRGKNTIWFLYIECKFPLISPETF